MSYSIRRGGVVGLLVMLGSCAYPQLQMGEDYPLAEGGSRATGGSLNNGGSPTTGGTSLVPASGGAVVVPASGGAVVTPANGGAVVTPATGGRNATGGAAAVGGATPATGGAVAASGGVTGVGGTISTVGTGGFVGIAGGPAVCTATTNLIAEAASSPTGNWVGGDPASTFDNPCGVQGSIYVYSDNGLDNVQGNADDTVQSPGRDPTSSNGLARLSPCTGGKCCFSGVTSTYPLVAGLPDYTASVWGGGIGISLGDPGAGGIKKAYLGAIKGLNVTISGTLNGQVLRFGYTQSATDVCAPFIQVTSVGTIAMPFVGKVTCPLWVCSPSCVPPGTAPYDLQVQIVGGDAAGTFNICIDSMTPIF